MMFASCGAQLHWGWKYATSGTPAVEPITLAEAKLFLRVDASGEDQLIDALIVAARQMVEEHTSRRCITQTIELSFDGVPAERVLPIPFAPVASISSIVSYDTDNAATTFSANDYRLDTHSLPNRIVLDDDASWPSDLRQTNSLLVTAVLGYGSSGASVTDKALMGAMKLLITHWYEHRNAVHSGVGEVSKEIELAYWALVSMVKVPWL